MHDIKECWKSVDPLGEVLHLLRMSGTLYCRSEFTAPWALELPPMPDCLMFHVVISGECWLDVPGDEPRWLQPCDFVLVPHGEGHLLSSAPGVPAAKLFDLPHELVSERYEILRYGEGGEPTSMICGAVRFDHPAVYRLIQLLPKVIRIELDHSPQAEWIQQTLRFMADEARHIRPGGETIITRLADILVIQALRSWIEQAPAAQTGWLGALKDHQIGRAISLIHRAPAHPWTLATLAEEVAMSRSAFAARFTEIVGEPAMYYLTQWRMNLALMWLKENDMPLSDVAERLGYQSEAAFSRAFKRVMGNSPGAVRRHNGNLLRE
ncbi:MAG TPA: AraC family transcriptional regulator [Acidobacteriota bacterium]|nr:AraC family transcriptional regulator [Acidobacteriota bacterium]HMZ81439.1 AraC family transcriptional regulator [Acidobacteriota bacterium]HNB71994.1 AraC family transcriptional regulator [Acidobacteriota bacterium]HND22475.1 AraC family transcriptional regulator [Acidobacteriota bacterium]HNG95558.1 AraC family transcriptional regulator [Acidobacteriota bacterium]